MSSKLDSSRYNMSSTTMLRNKKKSTSKQTKRVRFHELIEIIEIEQIDQHSPLIEEGLKHNTAGSMKSNNLGKSEDCSSTTTSCTPRQLLHDKISSCSTSNSHRSYRKLPKPPVDNPLKIPPTLFNMPPLPNDISFPSGHSHNCRWNDINKTRLHSFSLSAPVRAPSMDQIIDSALAILTDAPPPKGATDLKRQHSDSSNRKNDSWEFGYDTKERWRDDPQSPPKIPRRKISMEDVSRRKI